ncbi:MAG: ATPase, T2SS/T4P/T4SS family [Candidatus Njordarchaeota archaeon]
MSNARKKYVVDLSLIESGGLKKQQIIELIPDGIFYVHSLIVRRLKKMADEGLDEGRIGIELLEEFGKKARLEFEFSDTPDRVSIEEVLIELAMRLGATVLTSSKDMYRLCKSFGVDAILVIQKIDVNDLIINKLFDSETLSVHLKEGCVPVRKKGVPGRWIFEQIRDKPMSYDELREIMLEIIEASRSIQDGFIEIERPGSMIIQLKDMRIVITRPPFSDGLEITAVRPIRKLHINDYDLPEKLLRRFELKAEGILISGSPGAGKTTFAQALAEFYREKRKIVKTIEAPRDMQLSAEITQYSKNYGTPEELHDILLLSRPDYCIFDEIRNIEDVKLFADLRLAGIGMVGVIHSTTAIDAIQRFVGKIELGMIPSIIDTVIHMRNGSVEKVLALRTTVKVPYGLKSEDLARPVVVVYDFMTGKPFFEMYTFGERTFVVPVSKEASREIYGAESIEGPASRESVIYTLKVSRRAFIFDFGKEHGSRHVVGYAGPAIVARGLTSRSGKLRISRRSRSGKLIESALERGEELKFYVEE